MTEMKKTDLTLENMCEAYEKAATERDALSLIVDTCRTFSNEIDERTYIANVRAVTRRPREVGEIEDTSPLGRLMLTASSAAYAAVVMAEKERDVADRYADRIDRLKIAGCDAATAACNAMLVWAPSLRSGLSTDEIRSGEGAFHADRDTFLRAMEWAGRDMLEVWDFSSIEIAYLTTLMSAMSSADVIRLRETASALLDVAA